MQHCAIAAPQGMQPCRWCTPVQSAPLAGAATPYITLAADHTQVLARGRLLSTHTVQQQCKQGMQLMQSAAVARAGLCPPPCSDRQCSSSASRVCSQWHRKHQPGQGVGLPPALVAGVAAAQPRPAASARRHPPARPRPQAACPAAARRPRAALCLPLPTLAAAASAGCTHSATGPCTTDSAGLHRKQQARKGPVRHSVLTQPTWAAPAVAGLLSLICTGFVMKHPRQRPDLAPTCLHRPSGMQP